MVQSAASPPLVVHIIDALPPHGAERLLVDVVKNFSEEFRLQVLCLEFGGHLALELKEQGIPVVTLGYRGKYDLRILFRLIRWFRANRPSVVHTHLFTADFWGRLAAKLAGIKVIFSTSHSVNSWKGPVHRFLDRCLARWTTRVIACSSVVATILRERDRIPERSVVVIPNGIDLARLRHAHPLDLAAEFGLTGPLPVTMAVIGRLHPVKGHRELLPVIAALQAEGVDFHLFLVGDGEMRNEIKQRIAALGIGARVTLTGFREDVVNILAAIDILLMPSLWEGLPLSLLEGMAMGKAVLATAVGGIPDVVRDGHNGLLVPARDPEALAQGLRRLIFERGLRIALGRAAKATVAASHSAESVCRRYEALYRVALTAAH